MKNKFGFILVRPQLGENIGASARSIKNFGFKKLSIVAPKFNFPNHKAKTTSVGAFDVINKTKVFSSIDKAVETFSNVIDLDPSWAEAWNKRATVYYMIGEFEKSQADINKVLELESRHFGALAGQGLVNIELENYEKAIKSYQQAQEIYPSMQSPKIMIEKIKKLIKKQSV